MRLQHNCTKYTRFFPLFLSSSSGKMSYLAAVCFSIADNYKIIFLPSIFYGGKSTVWHESWSIQILRHVHVIRVHLITTGTQTAI